MNESKRVPNLFLENAEVLSGTWRNFAGRGGMYNKEGDRNFNIVITEDSSMFYEVMENGRKRYRKVSVQDLIRDGWKLKQLKPRYEDDENAPPRYKLLIAVDFTYEKKYKGVPPTLVYLYSGGKRTLLSEETISALDYADYCTADLTVHPRHWVREQTGEEGIKAYLREMRVVIQPDRWAEKYAEYDKPDDGGDDSDSEYLPF